MNTQFLVNETLLPQLRVAEVNGSAYLQLSKITVNDDYCKKWNVREKDFICLSKNGQLIRDTLYRFGGLNYPNPKKDRYFMLLKHVEAFYSKDILRMSGSKDAKHLEGRWCILDQNGNEKAEFEQFKHPYLVADSCIYTIDSKYYNIETGELYCYSSSTMQSTDFLFLDNKYDHDKSKRGVMKINKQTGVCELIQ